MTHTPFSPVSPDPSTTADHGATGPGPSDAAPAPDAATDTAEEQRAATAEMEPESQAGDAASVSERPVQEPTGSTPVTTKPRIDMNKVDPDAVKVVQRLRRFDHAAYLVGGCVRDLMLGGKPKDFDVATSATPNDLRRLFRNCRIIGRRFRLAHIFFGPKVIETSTFRANPREVEAEEDERAETPAAEVAGGPSDSLEMPAAEPAPEEVPNGEGRHRRDRREARASDLLIRRDNVFGTAEEDARRRDFTVNGLFLDVDSGEVIDYVGGMPDLEARLVRTIGDPDIRFREDPVRILRAVKFAARCDLTIEAETYQRMREHANEIAKCAHARVSEEFFRLLRAGAGKRSMELLVETELLEVLVPVLAAWLRVPTEGDERATRDRQRFWSYLRALDETTQSSQAAPSNALILSVLLLGPLRDSLDPKVPMRETMARLGDSMAPLVDQLKASRRDSDNARQLLLNLRSLLPAEGQTPRRSRLGHRDIAAESVRLLDIVARAESFPEATEVVARLAAELTPPPSSSPPAPSSGVGLAAEPTSVRVGPRGLAPIPDLPDPTSPAPRPAFMGTGAFGARWGRASD